MLYFTTTNTFRFSLVLLGFITLVACGGVDEAALPVNEAPTASSVNIADANGGDAVVGDDLTGNYVYADAEDDAEGASIYRWLRNSSVIGGATASTYTLTLDDIGQPIIFEVTPVAISGAIGATTGALTGTAIASVAFVPNSSPIANAGADQTPLVNDTVTLDGSGSSDVDGDLLTYSWSFSSKPPGSQAILTGSTTLNPSFMVDVPGDYVVQLIVNDGMVDSVPNTVTISTNNSAPVADAGPGQSALFGDTVALNGSASSDVDGDGVTYSWSFTSKPVGSTAALSDSTAVGPTFKIDVSGDYQVQLIVNDGTVDSDPDTVIISTNNTAPVANAGADQAPLVNDTVTLDGSTSSDVDGDGLTFSWSFTSVPTDSAAALSDPAAVLPTFVVDQPGSYVVQLIVNDATVDSDPDTVIISTDNSAPVANAGPGQSTLNGDTVILDGSGSSDVDNDGLTYSWSITSKPALSTATLTNPTTVNPTFAIDVSGDYVVQLIVNDGTLDSDPDTVIISTNNTAPVATAGADKEAPLVNETVTLDGNASSDVDGNGLTFSWSFSSFPTDSTVALSDPAAVTPTFTVDLPGTYVVQLIVNDGTVNSDPVTVTIITTNSAPTASVVSITDTNGGSVVVGDSLTGSYTYADVDGDLEGTSTFRWLRNGTTTVGTGASYTLVALDSGQSITFEVTPVDDTGNTGSPATSAGLTVANSVPTASNVTIGGGTVVGSLLTGNYDFADADGDLEGASTFRWLRNGTTTVGTGASYTLVALDSGQSITFEVTPVDDTGSTGSPATSAGLTVANSVPTASNVTIGGGTVVGSLLTGNYDFADADGDAEGASTFRWLRNGTTTVGTGASYTLVALDSGQSITFEVTPVDDTGSTGSPATSAGLTVANSVPTASNVTIGGGTVVGSLLTGNYDFADADGDAEGASTFRWLRNGTTTVGTGASYTLVALDSGQTITFEVTPVDDTGSTGSPATSAGLTVANSVPTASNVTIGGGTVVGSLLTGNYDFADADGDLEGASTFRWLRNSTTTVGTGASYTLVALDSGQSINFEVTPVDDTGSTGSPATSAGLTVANSVPTASNVTIGGGTVVGSLLTGNYDFADADGDLEGASTFRWLRNGTTTVGTGASYTLVALDSGQSITFEVTPVDDTGSTGSPATSAGLTVANSVPTASNVTIGGGTVVGSLLTGNYDFADADGDLEGASTFRWIRNGTTTVGTGASYTLVALDSGQSITFEVTPVDDTGSTGSPATSAGLTVANSVPTASNVTIGGGTVVGSLLTGNYDFADADGDLEGASTFRWLRNGTTTVGTGASYTLVALDSGQSITFEVTPVDDTGSTGSPATSAGLTVANSVPTASNVTIGGGTVVGSLLTGNYDFADIDGDLEGVSTFRWLRNGTTTVGTGASYTLVALDSGQTITFEVTPVDDTGNIGSPATSAGITVD